MASTYNFTIRAEDSQGAFADRDFSIVIRNTSVDRYMVVDTNDAYTSPDMVTWTRRIGQGGNNVSYGGGKWLVKYGGLSSISYRLSSDGINFTTHTITIPELIGTITVRCQPVWNRDHWWAVINKSNDYNVLVRSSDGITWEAVARSYSVGENLNPGLSFIDNKVVFTSSVLSTKYMQYDGDTQAASYNTVLTSPNVPHGANLNWTPPIKVNDLYIMIGRNTSATPVFTAYYSPNYREWYRGTFINRNGTHNVGVIKSLTYINGKIYTISAGSASVPSSTNANFPVSTSNGKDWIFQKWPELISTNGYEVFSSVVPAKGKVWYVHGLNKFSTADHGVTWEPAVDNFPSNITITGFATIR